MTKLEGVKDLMEQRIGAIETRVENLQKSMDKLFYLLLALVVEVALTGVGILA